MRTTLIAFCAATGMTIAAFPAAAQTVTYADEYQNRIKAAGALQALDDNAFGEQVDLYTGTTSFAQTDLVLEGKGPPIVIARSTPKNDFSETDPLKFTGMGDWELDIPQIVTLVPGTVKYGSTVGDWRNRDSSGSPSAARCTYFAAGPWSPPWGYYGPHSGDIHAGQWWRGYALKIPGSGEQTLLARGSQAPGPASGTYPGVTTGHWQVGCLPNTTNGQPGEGFLVLAPDGTKYFLTHLTYDTYETIQENDPYDPDTWSVLPRNIARMKASRVEDRFGNYITYTYTGDRLTSITGSDGRSVAIQWWPDAPLVQSITTNGRTWTYNYVSRSAIGGILSQVTLPDNTSWAFSGSPITGGAYGFAMTGCFPGTLSTSDSTTVVTYAIKHPAGATATFGFSNRVRGQSYYPSFCTSIAGGDAFETGNPYFSVGALVQRSITGPGLPARTWSYVYEPQHASVDRNCPNNSCASTTYTDVTDPEGNRTRYLHSTRFGALQGKLLRVERYQGSSTQKQTEDHLYNYTESDHPYPGTYGNSMGAADSAYATENLVLRRKTTTGRDGRNFVWEVPGGCAGGLTGYCFDAFGRPTKTVKSSSP